MRNKNGITLIALVITIIVLLILAGVTVITLTGENGLLAKLSKAQEDQKIAEAREEIELALQALVIEERTAENVDRVGILTDDLKKADKDVIVVSTGEKGFSITHRGYEFKVDENYKVTYKGSSESDTSGFDAAAWDAKALPESYFYWGNDDPRDPEYNTITGFNPPAGEVITELIIPSRCKRIESYSFSNNENITSVQIPETTIIINEEAFLYCTNLSGITLPDSINEVGNDVFRGTAWYNNQPDGEVVYIGKVAYKYKGDMPANAIIQLKEGTKIIANNAFSNCSNLINIDLGNDLISIGTDALYGCNNLESIEIPDSVTTIKSSAFSGCNNLESVKLSNNMTVIENGLFANCFCLQKITIPSGVTEIRNDAFEWCTSLAEITIPDSVTRVAFDAFEETAWYNNQQEGIVYAGNVAFSYKGDIPQGGNVQIKDGTKIIENNLFEYKDALTSIIIPNSVTSIGVSAFRGTGLTSVSIPSGVTTIEMNTFSNCYSLVTVQLPDTITKIEEGAFMDCSSLSAIELPDNLITIGPNAFQRCSSLETMEIPDKVTSIDTCAFGDCSNLSSFSLSKSVKSIGTCAFEGCKKLNNIIIWKNVDEVRSRAFRDWGSTQTIHVEAESQPEGWALNWKGDECKAEVIYASTGN